MNVGEFFAKLSYGELSNLSIGMEGAGTIDDAQQDKVVSYINSALTALYSRFTHKRDYVNLTLLEGVQNYNLSDQVDDVVKILSIRQEDDPVTVEDESEELKIQVHPALGGLKMVDYKEIFVPNPVAGVKLLIEYQAKHPPLSIPVDLTEQIILAPLLEEALEMRVAARIFGAMNGEANLVKQQQLMKRYEHICFLVENEDLLQESETTGVDKLRDKGFI